MHERTEIHVKGMDCADCTRHVAKALREVDGVHDAQVFLSSEKAVVQHDPTTSLEILRAAVQSSGYEVESDEIDNQRASPGASLLRLTTIVFVMVSLVLLFVVIGEWTGWLGSLSEVIPAPVYIVLIVLGGWPVFRSVTSAARRREITSHTLMTIGMLAAIVVGEWATAVIIVFFMRVGDAVEQWTAQGARRALKDLHALTPREAWVLRDGKDERIPVEQIKIGDLVIVRPGETIPVDGVVEKGQATIDQSALTGESMPLEVESGNRVFAASITMLGSLQIRVEDVGSETTIGKVVQLVEEAEANQGRVQRFADRFSSYYLPIVLAAASLTYAISRDPLATAAVLVVVCSCAIALATPIAMVASIGSAAKSGLIIKGGRFIELLPQVDVLLIDKTGTLTLGKPQITQIIPRGGIGPDRLLSLAAAVERYSEHPLADAVTTAAIERDLRIEEPEDFKAFPGRGAQATVNGSLVRVGNHRFIQAGENPDHEILTEFSGTPIFVEQDGEWIGSLVSADILRADVPLAIESLRTRGLKNFELLTGDYEAVARLIAAELEIDYQAELLPDEKLGIVESYQLAGKKVAMIGDGINDAPALAKADIGIAMGAAGSDIAMETADVVLMRDDWSLIPELFSLSDRTMAVVRMNLVFTGIYNLFGILLAAFGILPPILAAAAQSIPDLGILANSSRLLRRG